jgi:hypothetical protein
MVIECNGYGVREAWSRGRRRRVTVTTQHLTRVLRLCHNFFALVYVFVF